MPENENQDLWMEDKKDPIAVGVDASPIEPVDPGNQPVVIDNPARPVEPYSNPIPPMKNEPAAPAWDKNHRPEGIILIAIYHFLVGLPGLLAGFVIATIPVIAVIRNVSDPASLTIALIGLSLTVLLTGGAGLLMIITGIGLLRMRNWARWLAITFACLSLLLYPLGTIIGGLILVYLLTERVSKQFTRR
jgi:hypothetical protein